MSLTLLLYAASLILVIWAISDIIRQPQRKMGRNRKLSWGLAVGIGWLFLGFVGAGIAAFYLIGVRPRLQRIDR